MNVCVYILGKCTFNTNLFVCVKVFDGLLFPPMINDVSIAGGLILHSGDSLPTPSSVQSSSNKLTVVFTSDECEVHPGFQANYVEGKIRMVKYTNRQLLKDIALPISIPIPLRSWSNSIIIFTFDILHPSRNRNIHISRCLTLASRCCLEQRISRSVFQYYLFHVLNCHQLLQDLKPFRKIFFKRYILNIIYIHVSTIGCISSSI